jgi:biotin carboxyl carrier protein
VVVVEAMKMENELCAERPGVVTKVEATVGQSVDSGAVLIELGPLPDGSAHPDTQ